MVLFNEVEIVLEVLGVAAAGNFVARKLLFAKDRDQTVDQIKYACCCCALCKQILNSFCYFGWYCIEPELIPSPLAMRPMLFHCAINNHVWSTCAPCGVSNLKVQPAKSNLGSLQACLQLASCQGLIPVHVRLFGFLKAVTIDC